MSSQNKVISGPSSVPNNYSLANYDINNDEKVVQVYNFINGKYSAPIGARYFCNVNPAKNQVISHVPCSDQYDIMTAVKAASDAFPSWSKKTLTERAKYLLAMAAQIEKRHSEFAILESRDVGKVYQNQSHGDVQHCIGILRFFAAQVEQATTDTLIRHNEDKMDYIYRKALGVVACITPWNFPLIIIVEQIAPAILYGNCIVCKPCELTPMTATLITDVLLNIKLPNGVVNIVHGFGSEAGVPLCEHPRVRALAFVGGCVTGKKINQQCASTLKRVKLELGGKNASIVFDDVDIKQTVQKTAASAFANQGEICVCGSRLFVQEKIYDEFVKQFVQHTKQVWSNSVGDPLKQSSLSGSLISYNHRAKVEGYVQLALSEGGNILCGGKRAKVDGLNGFFYSPTVITGLAWNSRCATEEIFGPVVTIHSFRNEEEVLKMVNFVEYGLAGSVFTTNFKRAHKVAQSVESGRVWVNHWGEFHNAMPFGGVKGSGFGRQGGKWSIDFWTMCKHISCSL